MADTWTPEEFSISYEPPTLVEVGDAVDLTRGTAADDTADMNTARYW